MKNLAYALLALAILAVPALAATDNVDYGAQYSLQCCNLSGDVTTMAYEQFLDTITCIYYTRGALHGLLLAEGIAEKYGYALYDVPGNLGVEQLAKITLRYIERHPESMHEPTIGLMGVALEETYPPKTARRR